MKFSESLLVSVVVATNANMEPNLTNSQKMGFPPRHPVQRLQRLVEFSADLLSHSFTALRSKDIWIQKFENNAQRMEIAFGRCGFHNDRKKRASEEIGTEIGELEKIEYGCIGTKQITTGFAKWAQRYIGNCSGQRTFQHQTNRMDRWNKRLQQFLGCK